jgi:bifunctional ADP-heptose synthase (sugar kinase/adenylyltransferase)
VGTDGAGSVAVVAAPLGGTTGSTGSVRVVGEAEVATGAGAAFSVVATISAGSVATSKAIEEEVTEFTGAGGIVVSPVGSELVEEAELAEPMPFCSVSTW